MKNTIVVLIFIMAIFSVILVAIVQSADENMFKEIHGTETKACWCPDDSNIGE